MTNYAEAQVNVHTKIKFWYVFVCFEHIFL